jgi:hypothetical protein
MVVENSGLPIKRLPRTQIVAPDTAFANFAQGSSSVRAGSGSPAFA